MYPNLTCLLNTCFLSRFAIGQDFVELKKNSMVLYSTKSIKQTRFLTDKMISLPLIAEQCFKDTFQIYRPSQENWLFSFVDPHL